MSLKILSLRAALVATAVSAAGAVPAVADVPVAADPTAQNVTAYAATAAWSRKASDGYRLVVAHGGAVADAPVPASSTPYDADLGPTTANGRTIVYARGGDLYRYDIGAQAEQKLTALSSSATETAPSFFKDRIVFSRSTGKRKGLYLLRPGRPLTRVFRTVAAETDIAETRIIGRFGKGSRSIIRILNMNASQVRIVTRAKTGQRVSSPTLTRFNGIWLRIGATQSTVEQVGVNGHRGLDVLTADRPLLGRVDSLASYKIPTLYTNRTAVQRIAPKLRMR
ncbi:MAG: hypothetical protein WKF48_08825 [Solirubrobacteraceae bacterium]